jgi:hypothetical protein
MIFLEEKNLNDAQADYYERKEICLKIIVLLPINIANEKNSDKAF